MCYPRLLWFSAPQLKSAVSDVEQLAGKDDHYFLRWLRARKFDLAKSEDMLRKVSSYHKVPRVLIESVCIIPALLVNCYFLSFITAHRDEEEVQTGHHPDRLQAK